jgi:hypothetical protein
MAPACRNVLALMPRCNRDDHDANGNGRFPMRRWGPACPQVGSRPRECARALRKGFVRSAGSVGALLEGDTERGAMHLVQHSARNDC